MATIQTRKTYTGINFLSFAVGMIMVWHLTHSGWVLFWTFIASLHFSTAIAKVVYRDAHHLRPQDPTFLRRVSASDIDNG